MPLLFVLILKEKHTFQNPIRQNYRHTRCLSEYLRLDHTRFHSVVWLIGDCTFKTKMPPNVLNSGLVPYLKTFANPCLTEVQVDEIEAALRALKANPVATASEHIRSLRERHRPGHRSRR
jgi:restriction system protein